MKYILTLIIGVLTLSGCGYRLVPEEILPDSEWIPGMHPGFESGGTVWGEGSFDTNGERIYFTATNEEGERIRYSGGPRTGMMISGFLSCASCHGSDGRGGEHIMHMQIMDAPDIRWESLIHEVEEHLENVDNQHGEYDLEMFRRAVSEGEHPDGEPISNDMPRWHIGERDLEDLAEYLMSIP
jgi:hypothetical protein